MGTERNRRVLIQPLIDKLQKLSTSTTSRLNATDNPPREVSEIATPISTDQDQQVEQELAKFGVSYSDFDPSCYRCLIYPLKDLLSTNA